MIINLSLIFIAAPVKKLLDESWLELVTKFGKPIFLQVFDKEIDKINKIINNIPSNELEKHEILTTKLST